MRPVVHVPRPVVACVAAVGLGLGAITCDLEGSPAPPPTSSAHAELAPAAPVGPPPPGLPPTDTFSTPAGHLDVVPVHHATIRLAFAGQQIWIDPSSEGDLHGPKAKFVFLTDVHADHYDPKGLAAVRTAGTTVVVPPALAKEVPGAVAIPNGDGRLFDFFTAKAVPMYNLVRGPAAGKVFHEKGRGNGYLLDFSGFRVYVSGDTECTPEVQALPPVDVAFVCMNLPYTMPPDEAAACVKRFSPKVVFPYHYRGSDPEVFRKALADRSDIDVRIRDWYAATAVGADSTR